MRAARPAQRLHERLDARAAQTVALLKSMVAVQTWRVARRAPWECCAGAGRAERVECVQGAESCRRAACPCLQLEQLQRRAARKLQLQQPTVCGVQPCAQVEQVVCVGRARHEPGGGGNQ